MKPYRGFIDGWFVEVTSHRTVATLVLSPDEDLSDPPTPRGKFTTEHVRIEKLWPVTGYEMESPKPPSKALEMLDGLKFRITKDDD